MSRQKNAEQVRLEDVLSDTFEPMPVEARSRVRSRVLTGVATDEGLAGIRTLFVRSAASFAAVATLLAGTGYAAANSLPGDPLYPLKRAAEEVRVVFSPEAQQGEALMNMTRERAQEVRQLVEEEAEADDLERAAKNFGEAADRAVSGQPDSATAEEVRIEIEDTIADEPAEVRQQVEDKLPPNPDAPGTVEPTPNPSPGPAESPTDAEEKYKGDQSQEPDPKSPSSADPDPDPNDGVSGKSR